ncbi:hypothetical protein N7U66_11715 [Lacinutrix neustonica]|uniref:Uncharacterized protein n=1 Tax=Lacinutrix neustonica TaxID=2980107 RepID=A0A9E8SCN9_9FLAO|nr:hypothetical protein [Lacinutrix neustonica]WAC00902.1 hypothetical protein N7U66_11715 [Lacinutrix neustonica]
MDMCLFIPILVGLVCALLGYLLGKLSGDGNNRSNAVDVYKNRISILETELAGCKERLGNTKVVGNGISSGAGNSGQDQV